MEAKTRGTKRKITSDEDLSSISTVGSKSRRKTRTASSIDGKKDESVDAQRQHAREWAEKNLNIPTTHGANKSENRKCEIVKSPDVQPTDHSKTTLDHVTPRIYTAVHFPVDSVPEKSTFNRNLSSDSDISAPKRLSLQNRPKIVASPPSPSSEKRTTVIKLSGGSGLKNRISTTASAADVGPFSINDVESTNTLPENSVAAQRLKAREWASKLAYLPPASAHREIETAPKDKENDLPASIHSDLNKKLPLVDSPISTADIQPDRPLEPAPAPIPAAIFSSDGVRSHLSVALVRDRVLTPLVVALLLTACLRGDDSRVVAIGGVVSALAFSVLRRLVRGLVSTFSYIFGLVSEKED